MVGFSSISCICGGIGCPCACCTNICACIFSSGVGSFTSVINSSVSGWNFSDMISAAMRTKSLAYRWISRCMSFRRIVPNCALSCCAPKVSDADDEPRMMSAMPVISKMVVLTASRWL